MGIEPIRSLEVSASRAHSVAHPVTQSVAQAVAIPRASRLPRVLSDYIALTKPRILVMILLTVAVAMQAAPGSQVSFLVVVHALVGTGLLAASASTLNQWYERRHDALMPRTKNRPLPAGRLTSFEAAIFGWILIFAGTIELAWFTTPMSVVFGLLTWALYVWIYTPLKTMTWWNTAVGTLPGALPVMIGWTAAGGRVDESLGWLLTLIVVLWQFPHFMAIAWLYREQYAAAGYRMLTNIEPTGRAAAWHAIVPAVLLIPLSILVLTPNNVLTWMLAACGATVCVGMVRASYDFMGNRSEVTGRRLLRSSLLYLPAILILVAIRACL